MGQRVCNSVWDSEAVTQDGRGCNSVRLGQRGYNSVRDSETVTQYGTARLTLVTVCKAVTQAVTQYVWDSETVTQYETARL